MKQIIIKLVKSTVVFLLCLVFNSEIFSQALPLPYEIVNASEFADNEIYIALVGKQDDTDVWIDCATGAVNPMLVSDNTIQGPVIDGNTGPGTNGMYANVFRLLSNIPNKTIDIPHIHAVRIFISFKEQLYLYFFGAGGGYSAPSLSNATDPNQGIRYELIELTYGDNGLWTNTTRVDHYQYPMGIEVWGEGGFYKKVGEILTHNQIIDTWKNRVPSQFLACLDNDLEIIHAPSKTAAFAEDGAYFSYFDNYVDAVWARYTNEDLTLSIGEAGLYKGRVYGEEFRFTNQANGIVGIIRAKPNTQEIFEAKGVLATDEPSTPDIYADQNVQKHFSAAFNRGAIDVNAPAGAIIEWSNETEFFTHEPFNEYVKFWHSRDISFEGETYAFAYDDVFDYSSTIQSGAPTKVKVTIGGFAGQTPAGLSVPGVIQAEDFSAMFGIQTENTTDIGGGINVGWIDAGDWLDYQVNVSAAGTYNFNMRLAADGTAQKTVEVQAASTGSITFTATEGWQNWETESGTISLIAGEQTIRIYAVSSGFNLNWIEFTSNVTCDPTALFANYQVNGGAWISGQNATIDEDSEIKFGPQPDTGGNWSWTGPNGFTANSREITISNVQSSNAGIYVASFENNCGSVSSISHNLVINSLITACERYEAENWADMSGVQTEGTSDIGGGLNVGWINPGDWMNYNISVSTTANYIIKLRCATPNGPDQCRVLVDGVDAGTVNIDNTGDWQIWDTFETTISLSVGNHVLRLSAITDGFNVNYFELCHGETTNTAPIAIVNTNISTGTMPLTVSFDASNSLDIDGDALTYTWNFGDGLTGIGIAPSHTYTQVGTFSAVLTVSDGSLLSSDNETIVVNPVNTNCLVESANGDFSVEVSSSSSNPTLTFIPTVSGTGDNLLLLYYGTSPNGPYPGHMPEPNVPYEINATVGQTIYFYYTYNLASGGENNSAANKNSFVVGDCESSLKRAVLNINNKESMENVKAYPNPVNDILLVDIGENNFINLQLFDLTGKLVYNQDLNESSPLVKVHVADFEKGVYVLMISNHLTFKALRIIKE